MHFSFKYVIMYRFINFNNHTLQYIDVIYDKVVKTKEQHEVTKIASKDFSIPSFYIIFYLLNLYIMNVCYKIIPQGTNNHIK